MMIYTDASFIQKRKMSGIGFVIVDGDREHKSGFFTQKCQDNNSSEMVAIAGAIDYACKKRLFDKTKDKTVTIVTDSKYAILRYRDGYEGRDSIEKSMIDFVKDFMNNTNLKINFFYIKGHQPNKSKMEYYNNMADELSRKYRNMGISNLKNSFFMFENKNNPKER